MFKTLGYLQIFLSTKYALRLPIYNSSGYDNPVTTKVTLPYSSVYSLIFESLRYNHDRRGSSYDSKNY